MQTDTSSVAQALKAAAELSFEGWGAKVQAEFAMSSSRKRDVNRVYYIATRKYDLGYAGWGSVYPRLSEDAMDILRKYGPAKFRQSYGTHFVSGSKQGAKIELEMSREVTKTSTRSTVAAALKASYSGWGVSVGGSASFDKSKSVDTSSETQENRIFADGHTTEKSLALSLGQAIKDLDNFGEGLKGTKRCFVLKPFTLLEDYKQMVAAYYGETKEEAIGHAREKSDARVTKLLYEAFVVSDLLDQQIGDLLDGSTCEAVNQELSALSGALTTAAASIESLYQAMKQGTKVSSLELRKKLKKLKKIERRVQTTGTKVQQTKVCGCDYSCKDTFSKNTRKEKVTVTSLFPNKQNKA